MIKAVLFDWGGVLVSGGRSFWKYLTAETESETIDREAFHHIRIALNKGEITEDEFESRFLKLSGAKKIPDGFWDNQTILHMLPEMKEFLEVLQKKNLRIGLISNMGSKMADAIEAQGGYSYFDPLIISARVGLCKPDEEIFDLTLKKVGLSPEEIIFVDDLEVNLEYPKRLGMHTVFAHNSKQIIEDVTCLLGEK